MSNPNLTPKVRQGDALWRIVKGIGKVLAWACPPSGALALVDLILTYYKNLLAIPGMPVFLYAYVIFAGIAALVMLYWGWIQGQCPSNKLRAIEGSVKFFRDNEIRYRDLHDLKMKLAELGITSPHFDEQGGPPLEYVDEKTQRTWEQYLMRLHPLTELGLVRKARVIGRSLCS